MLLAVVSLAAVASWGYWIAWPWWRAQQEQARFIEAVKQIHIGSTPSDAWTIISGNRGHQPVRGYGGSKKGTTFGWLEYEWPNAVYLVAFDLQDGSSGNPDYMKSESVQLYRLPPPRAGYQPRTNSGQKELSNWKPGDAWAKDQDCYLMDCIDFFSGDQTHAPGFQFELIYSDPPATPAAK